MGHIYKHTSPSGKAYIGQSWEEPEVRWKQHVWCALGPARDACPSFYGAIRKYDPDAFTQEILHDGIADQDELDRLEIDSISEHGTLHPEGYNLTEGGAGGRHCEEVKKRIATTLSATNELPEVKARRSAASKLAMSRPDVKARLVVAQLEVQSRPDVNAKRRATLAKTNQCPEVKKRRSLASKKTAANPVTKAKKSAATKAMWEDPTSAVHTEEYWEKSRAGSKKANARPEVKAKISAALKKVHSCPEFKAA